ncbi:MAG: ABC transporter permease subunit [Pseudomonadota bacterium]
MKNWGWFGIIAMAAALPLLVLTGYALAPGWSWPEVVPTRLSARTLDFLAGQHAQIGRSIISSFAYSVCTVALTLALCLAPARHLAFAQFPGKRLVEGLLLAPALVPPMTFSMGVHVAFIHLGLVDTMAGVVLVLSTFSYPYMLRALVAGYQSFGTQYARCAANLGAGRMRILWQVELPLLTPAIIAGGSVVFLVAFSEYFLVFLIGGGRVPSFTGYLFPFLTSSDRSTGAALTLIFLLVPLALFGLVDLLVARRARARGMG